MVSPRRGGTRGAGNVAWGAAVVLLTVFSGCASNAQGPAAPPGPDPDRGSAPWEVLNDTVLATDAVGPSWVHWTDPALPDADLVYVDRKHWELWVMDQHGGRKRCLTRFRDNCLGVNFPLDRDGQGPDVHWKGDPEAHPFEPIILFKAENEATQHKAMRNAPSIGWANDLWALNVRTRRYTRLTRLARGEGLQHSALSQDGRWYVYPRRSDLKPSLTTFGPAVMVFNRLQVDANGDARLDPQFELAPLGSMYYEPNDIQRDPDGSYSLYYVAGPGTRLDPYRYRWQDNEDGRTGRNVRLAETGDLHEEFLMVSPSGDHLAWMRGTQPGVGYHADLYISHRDLSGAHRVTWYNDCKRWPGRCKRNGVQLSRLEWGKDGRSLYYGLWVHGGPLRPFLRTELHRLDLAGPGEEARSGGTD